MRAGRRRSGFAARTIGRRLLLATGVAPASSAVAAQDAAEARWNGDAAALQARLTPARRGRHRRHHRRLQGRRLPRGALAQGRLTEPAGRDDDSGRGAYGHVVVPEFGGPSVVSPQDLGCGFTSIDDRLEAARPRRAIRSNDRMNRGASPRAGVRS